MAGQDNRGDVLFLLVTSAKEPLEMLFGGTRRARVPGQPFRLLGDPFMFQQHRHQRPVRVVFPPPFNLPTHFYL